MNLAATPDRIRYRARWVFPVSSPPIENGIVEVEAGRIAAVHDRRDPQAVDLGNAAILPGLVNAHTHLEFSSLDAPLAPSQPFVDWIRALVAHRRGASTDSRSAVLRGYRECRQTGSTLIGEIATSTWGPENPVGNDCRAVVFRELLGLPLARKAEQLEIARSHLARAPESARQGVICGLSPHAPFSVHPELFRELVELAAAHRAPLAIHLAETKAELELLAQGSGDFVTLLEDFGVWDPTAILRGTRPLDYLRPLGELEHALVIHGNYLADDELDFLADHPRISVVYCPRTHAYFGHTAHPWRRMLARGIALAIGTDSRGSNPDLDLWRELRFLRANHPDVDPASLLQLGTIAGARALGLASDTGTLEPGKRADLAIAPLAAAVGATEPYELLFAASVRSFAAPIPKHG